jgi:hypothetical protein
MHDGGCSWGRRARAGPSLLGLHHWWRILDCALCVIPNGGASKDLYHLEKCGCVALPMWLSFFFCRSSSAAAVGSQSRRPSFPLARRHRQSAGWQGRR